MRKQLFAKCQYLLPQHVVSRFMGKLANSQSPWIKNRFIKRFIRAYRIDMREAIIENPALYTSFNQFFTRQLKPELRPVAGGQHDIACPVDGTIAEIGMIQRNRLLQAKGQYYNLETLLGGDTQLANQFMDGSFATLYLAPNNYHRVHMPLAGELTQTIYVPGSLFSVNRITSELIPNLYARNERFITVFNTAAGPMAVILVGAMIVGSMQTVWMEQPIRGKEILNQPAANKLVLEKGAELGQFLLGSTVIVLFGKRKTSWDLYKSAGDPVQFGQILGTVGAPVLCAV